MKLVGSRNPFQTRSTTSIPHSTSPTGPAESCRNPFQTRSTTSIVLTLGDGNIAQRGRNPFQTRSTTSIGRGPDRRRPRGVSQSLPNQVNDFNRKLLELAYRIFRVSQSLPNQVNDFNSPLPAHFDSKGLRRPGREHGFAGDFRPAIFQSIFF